MCANVYSTELDTTSDDPGHHYGRSAHASSNDLGHYCGISTRDFSLRSTVELQLTGDQSDDRGHHDLRAPHACFLHSTAPEFQIFSPFVFEHDVNPTIHRPYLQPPELHDHLGTTATTIKTLMPNGTHKPLQRDVCLEILFETTSTSSTSSSPSTLQDDISTGHLEAPACVSSTEPSAPSSTSGSISLADGLNYLCLQCQDAFYRRCDLNKHTNRIHNKRAKCSYEGCTQKPMAFEADVQRHIEAKHSAEGKAEIKCMVHGCMKTFSRKDNMLRHMTKRHPGDSLWNGR